MVLKKKFVVREDVLMTDITAVDFNAEELIT